MFYQVLLFAIISSAAVSLNEAGPPVHLRPRVRRIAGGILLTSITSVPFLVSINHTMGYLCTGTIIGKQEIITTADCVSDYRAEDLTIRFASLARSYGGRTASIEQIIIHKEYGPFRNVYDFAILKVAENMYCDMIGCKKIDLPDTIENLMPDTLVLIAGWGATQENLGNTFEAFITQVPIVSNHNCQKLYSELIKDSMFCTHKLGAGACQGDMGNPVFRLDGKHFILDGIVSWRRGCGYRNYADVHAKVSVVLDWILTLIT